MEKDTVEEQPVETSLADALGAAYDELAGDDDVQVEDVREVGEDSDGADTDEDNNIEDGGEESEDDAELEEVDESDDGEEPEKLAAPEHWSATDRELFASLDQPGQEFLLRRHKEMEADYTRKTQEVAEVKRFKDNFEQLYGPYRNHFATQGLDDQGAIRSLLGWYSSVQQDPKRAITALAQQYGVTFDQPAEDGFMDPAIKALKDELDSIKAQNTRNQQAQQQASIQSVQNQISAFSSETNTDGSLKYPHFEKVRANMSIAITADPSLTLESAYKKAVRLDDTLFSQEVEKSKSQQEAEKKEKAKQKVAQAKKAAQGMKSGSASVKKDKPKTLEQELAEEFDRQMNA